MRSRLVASQFKVKNDLMGFDVFAATPPLKMKRLVFRVSMVKDCVVGD